MNTLIEDLTCDNESGPGGAGNTGRSLTHHLVLAGRGLALMVATVDRTKRGLDPAASAPQGLTPQIKAVYDAWPDRFRSKVILGAGCWLWTACKDRRGYGRFGRTGRGTGTAHAHRYAWELTHGPIAARMDIDHLCRNPSCVRPDHLEPVSRGANIRRGAASNVAGWCRSGRHPWVHATILVESNGTKRCLPCRREHEHERTIRRAARRAEERVS